MSMKERIESESQAVIGISNEDLICKDCVYKLDDTKVLGNVSRCKRYTVKLVDTLLGGGCPKYEHE